MPPASASSPREILAPPWRERLSTGELGAEYGPKTSATYARHLQRHRDWSYRAPANKNATTADEALVAFVRLADGTTNPDVPAQELRTFELMVEQGLSARAAARSMGLSRESVRSYLRRIKARLGG